MKGGRGGMGRTRGKEREMVAGELKNEENERKWARGW